jgi:hypothetical protein
MKGLTVGVLDYGGWSEDNKHRTMAEALADLETGHLKWCKKQGIEKG